MRAVGGLVLRRGVPPWVGVDDHGGPHQIQTGVAGLEGDEEHGDVVAVEFVDELDAAFFRRLAGDGVERHVPFGQARADEFQERGELREHEHLLALVHACVDELNDGVEFRRGVFRVRVHQPRVAADLAQQREFGEDADLLGVEVGVLRFGERGAQALLVRGVQFALLAFQPDGEHVLDLLGQVGEHVLFESAFDEQADQRLQLVRHDGMFRTGRHDRLFVFLAELRVGAEQSRHEEIEDAPQFAQSVFNRRSGQCETVFGRDPFDGLRHFRGVVFDVLRLVKRHQRESAVGVVVDIAPQQIV